MITARRRRGYSLHLTAVYTAPQSLQYPGFTSPLPSNAATVKTVSVEVGGSGLLRFLDSSNSALTNPNASLHTLG